MRITGKINENVRPGWLLTAAGAILAALLTGNIIVVRQLTDAEKNIKIIGQTGGRSADYAEELRSIRDLKAVTAKNIKNSLTDMAKAKTLIYMRRDFRFRKKNAFWKNSLRS